MGCYLEEYRALVGTWTARLSVAVIGRSCRNEKGKNSNGVNDVVCNGVSIATDDRRSGAKPWTCR